MSIMLTRHIVYQMLGAHHPMRAHELELRGIAYMRDTRDFAEGVSSFREKRAARFALRATTHRRADFPWWAVAFDLSPGRVRPVPSRPRLA